MADKTIEATLDGLIPRLKETSDTPGLDAQAVLARLLAKPRSWVMAHPETTLTQGQARELEMLAARLEKGEPLPYVLGRWDFFGLELEVTPDVLIPRPETELLVERALAWLEERKGETGEVRALDVGTGNGCIAISLAANVPDLRLIATDVSPRALDVARRNAERLSVAGRITFLEADLFPAPLSFTPLFPAPFSLILANLPYIPSATLHDLPVFGREPTLALDGGADGLAQIRRLLAQVPAWLAPGGLLLMEIEASAGPAALALAGDAFAEAKICLHKDLAGRDRMVEVGIRP